MGAGSGSDSYLRLTQWARRRYREASGRLILSTGGRPSRYSAIEMAAWNRYMASSNAAAPG